MSKLDGELIQWYKSLTGWKYVIIGGIISGIGMFIMERLFR